MTTTPERFRRVAALFHEALAQDPAARGDWLARQCGGDASLQHEVERLLARDAAPRDLERDFAVFPAAPDPWLGTQLGPWRIVARIAEGGMGVVYRAERADGLFLQQVAIKLLRVAVADAVARQRFDAERRVLARLEHPNIARLLDGGTTQNGTPYLVMELVDGQPIDRHCEERRLPLTARLRLFVTVCRAVGFAHQNLVVHRDLKPGNVLVDAHGAPKLLDFGIARLLGDEGGAPTRTVARALTPEYASPEQLAGRELTTASDVYSLGVMLYELLTGRRPLVHTGHTPGEWERTVADAVPTRPSTAIGARTVRETEAAARFAATMGSTTRRLQRQLRGDLDRIVLMALRKEPERRYGSVEQLALDLERQLAGLPVSARADTWRYRASRFVRRNRIAVGAATAVVLALCAALVASLVGAERAHRSAQVADEERHRANAAARVAEDERNRAQVAAEHARIEASSFQLVAEFLSDTLGTMLPQRSDGLTGLLAQLEAHADRVRRQHADDPHLRANLLDALGKLAVRQGAFDAGEAWLREAQQIRVATFGERSLEAALSLGSLGYACYHRADYAAAAEHLDRALALQRELPAGVHTDVATAANDLAAALRKLGRFAEARALHEEALALRSKPGQEETLPVAESSNNLAIVLLNLGDAAAAAPHARRAVAIRRAILGSGHALALQAAGTLAGVLFETGDAAAAEELLREAAAGYRALGRAGDDGLGTTLSNLAALLVRKGAYEPAQPVAEEALAIAQRRFGNDHPDVALALERLGAIATERGDAARAQKALAEALRLHRAAFPAGHPRIASTLVWHAGALLAGDHVEAAERAAREALAIAERAQPAAADLLAPAEVALGRCAARFGRIEEARAHFQRALERYSSRRGSTSVEAERVRRLLAGLGG